MKYRAFFVLFQIHWYNHKSALFSKSKQIKNKHLIRLLSLPGGHYLWLLTGPQVEANWMCHSLYKPRWCVSPHATLSFSKSPLWSESLWNNVICHIQLPSTDTICLCLFSHFTTSFLILCSLSYPRTEYNTARQVRRKI